MGQQLRHVASRRLRKPITGQSQHQRRRLHDGQDVSDIGRTGDVGFHLDHRRTRPRPLEHPAHAHVSGRREPRHHHAEHLALPPVLVQALHRPVVCLDLLGIPPANELIHRRRAPALRERDDEHERVHSVGVLRREHGDVQARFVRGVDGRAVKACRIHHRAQVSRSLLKRRDMVDRIRQAHPELVVHQTLAAVGDAHKRVDESRVRPPEIQVPKARDDVDHPTLARTEPLEGDAPPLPDYVSHLGRDLHPERDPKSDPRSAHQRYISLAPATHSVCAASRTLAFAGGRSPRSSACCHQGRTDVALYLVKCSGAFCRAFSRTRFLSQAPSRPRRQRVFAPPPRLTTRPPRCFVRVVSLGDRVV